MRGTHMGYQVLSLDEVMAAGRENPEYAMPEGEYPGMIGALSRIGLSFLAEDLTPQAALEAGLNYYAAEGLTLVTVDHTSAGSMYVFSKDA
jgi:hypothetical protein